MGRLRVSDWIEVTEEEAKSFIARYPRKLEHNFFMDSHSWHDFSDRDYGNSFVVMGDIDYGSDKLSYRIHKNFYKKVKDETSQS